jgi:type III secretion system FlhB-like substrate exporter
MTRRKLAVGVKFVAGDPAPRLLFRARGEQAARVLELARKFQVPLKTEHELAELLYQLPEGAWIPENHFRVLAQLLATIYLLSQKNYEST